MIRQAIRTFALLLLMAGTAAAEPRTAILTAFAPEFEAIRARMTDAEKVTRRGATYYLGTLGGRKVIVGQTGISMVNAAMNTQLLAGLFDLKSIVVSGIAGGVSPSLEIGDVVVPARWSQYLEAAFARKRAGGGYDLPPFLGRDIANYGMIFPQRITVWREGLNDKPKQWFEADPAMLEAARKAAKSVRLIRCNVKKAKKDECLDREPAVAVGGNGVSGQAFVDNKAFREYAYKTFKADALDMETAAVAMVAYANRIPFVAVRSLSDLAGGEPHRNAIGVFFAIAAQNSARVVEALVGNLPENR